MKQNPNNGFWQYGKNSSPYYGGDGIIVAFNGERVSGQLKPGDLVCVGGTVLLSGMTNNSGCGTGYTSYDEHPGYDYKATIGTPVYAAASGTILNINGERCYIANMGGTCDSWGLVGIDHGNGYITQYGHLSSILVSAGSSVTEGQLIGYSGNIAPSATPVGAHLHFEVFKKIGNTYYVVDPYGWTGGSSNPDPLYSVPYVTPVKLWK